MHRMPRKTSFLSKSSRKETTCIDGPKRCSRLCLGGARRNASNAIPSPPTGKSRIKAQSGTKIRAADFDEIKHLSNTNEAHDAGRWPAGRRLELVSLGVCFLKTARTAQGRSLPNGIANDSAGVGKRPFAGLIPAQSFSDSQRFGHAMRQGINARRPRVQR